MKGTELLIGDDFDLLIQPVRDSAGKIFKGLQIGNTLFQNQALILLLQPGEIKLSPYVGVGIENIIAGKDILGWRRKIRQQLEYDGQKVTAVNFKNEKLAIDAQYHNR
jgi:hypothetical protein